MYLEKVLHEDFDLFETKYFNKTSKNFTWQELEYNQERNEYIDKNDARTYFPSEESFIEAITRKELHICFSVSVTLNMRGLGHLGLGYPAYWQPYQDEYGNWIKNDHPAQQDGYTLFEYLEFFDGYVSPVNNKVFLKEFLNDSDEKILLANVFLIELFNDDRKGRFYKGKEYFLNTEKSFMTEVSISNGMFLKYELEAARSNVSSRENSVFNIVSNKEVHSQELTKNILVADQFFHSEKSAKEKEQKKGIEEANEWAKFFAREEQYIADDINERIKLFLINLRRVRSNRLVDKTKITRIYKDIPNFINQLDYRLDKLPKNEAGERGLRLEVKKFMKENHLDLYKELMKNESTFDQIWSDLMNDIKKSNNILTI